VELEDGGSSHSCFFILMGLENAKSLGGLIFNTSDTS